MYLSATSFGTWLEIGLPEAEYFQVSSFTIENEYEKNMVLSSLEIFPLVIATSYHVSEMNRKFKSEYIISQIIMQVCNELNIDGVAYLSKRMPDFYAYPQV